MKRKLTACVVGIGYLVVLVCLLVIQLQSIMGNIEKIFATAAAFILVLPTAILLKLYMNLKFEKKQAEKQLHNKMKQQAVSLVMNKNQSQYPEHEKHELKKQELGKLEFINHEYDKHELINHENEKYKPEKYEFMNHKPEKHELKQEPYDLIDNYENISYENNKHPAEKHLSENFSAEKQQTGTQQSEPKVFPKVLTYDVFEILADQFGLSRREREVAWLMHKNYTNMQIAEELFISVTTVKKHVTHIFEKFDIMSRKEFKSMLCVKQVEMSSQSETRIVSKKQE